MPKNAKVQSPNDQTGMDSEAMMNSYRKPREEAPGSVININLNDALSYGSMVELKDVLRGDSQKALIACALKSRKILIIMLVPGSTSNSTNGGKANSSDDTNADMSIDTYRSNGVAANSSSD